MRAALEVGKMGATAPNLPRCTGRPRNASRMEFWKEDRQRVLTGQLSRRAALKDYRLGWSQRCKTFRTNTSENSTL
jgi:hypothetical protein